MNAILPVSLLLISIQGFAQCPYPAKIRSKADFCLGSTLEVSTAHALTKIVWYKDGVAVDSNVIVKTYPPTGITVAGGHGTGAGDNQFTSPSTICVDEAGNLYVLDAENGRVQKWAPGAGAGVTLADHQGCQPNSVSWTVFGGIALDKQGNLYISDAANNRIQKWTPGDPCGVTVAGGNGAGAGADQLNGPAGLFIDCDGNLYIADAANFRIQKWAPGASSGVTVVTVPDFSSPHAIALNQIAVDANGNIYANDLNNGQRVIKWTPGSINGVTVAGGNGQGSNANQIAQPEGLFVDYAGDVFVSDSQNSRVQEWTPGAASGITLVSYPTGAHDNLSQFWGFCFDQNGNIYAADFIRQLIEEWKMDTPPIDSTYTPTAAGKYSAVCYDMAGYPATTDTVIVNDRQAGNPSIRISATATNISVCTPVTFTATTTNAGLAPSFQWQISGVNVGTNSPTYSNNLFADADEVICILSANVGCTGQPELDTSNLIKLFVDPHGTAYVNIIASNNNVCQGDEISFQATVYNGSANPVFQWFVNGTDVNDQTDTYSSKSLVSGDVVYCTIISDNICGLAKSNSLSVIVNNPPVIEPGQVFLIPHGTTQTLDPVITGDVASYLWAPATGLSDPTVRDPIADPLVNTLYTLKVVSPGGCKDSATIMVDVFTPLRIPNAFTPNGDGRNDIFFVLGGPENSVIEDFAIFNRWGQRIFQVHDVAPGDPAYGWNGKYGGKAEPAGTYVYIVRMKYGDGSHQVYKGTVVLLR